MSVLYNMVEDCLSILSIYKLNPDFHAFCIILLLKCWICIYKSVYVREKLGYIVRHIAIMIYN